MQLVRRLAAVVADQERRLAKPTPPVDAHRGVVVAPAAPLLPYRTDSAQAPSPRYSLKRANPYSGFESRGGSAAGSTGDGATAQRAAFDVTDAADSSAMHELALAAACTLASLPNDPSLPSNSAASHMLFHNLGYPGSLLPGAAMLPPPLLSVSSPTAPPPSCTPLFLVPGGSTSGSEARSPSAAKVGHGHHALVMMPQQALFPGSVPAPLLLHAPSTPAVQQQQQQLQPPPPPVAAKKSRFVGRSCNYCGATGAWRGHPLGGCGRCVARGVAFLVFVWFGLVEMTLLAASVCVRPAKPPSLPACRPRSRGLDIGVLCAQKHPSGANKATVCCATPAGYTPSSCEYGRRGLGHPLLLHTSPAPSPTATPPLVPDTASCLVRA